MTDRTIDPITFELFKNAIFSIADEMALTVTLRALLVRLRERGLRSVTLRAACADAQPG